MIKVLTNLFILLLLASCTETGEPDKAEKISDQPHTAVADTGDSETANEHAPRLTLEQLQQDLDIPAISEPWSGDLDGMIERRVIRVLTVYGLGRYFIDHGSRVA